MIEPMQRYNPLKVEEEVTKYWKERGIPKKVMESNRGKPIFAFLEGPPTANGFMHIGHARGRVYKDVYIRFMTMRGMDVWRQAGWDCQGLPTELEVEKKLGFTAKKDVEKFGLDKFVEEANRLVDYYISHWREASERLGLWLDYDNAYETRRDEYMEHVWHLLKKAYEEGDLYESYKVVPYCPRCETPLSSHEVALGYEEVTDPSIYVKFELEGKHDEYVVIWTTTPWTIPGNEAVAVNPDQVYVKIKVGKEVWILAEGCYERVLRDELKIKDFNVVKRVKGSDLEGIKYIHPLAEEVPAHREHKGAAHTLVTATFVSIEEGTGCVHTAPAHGPEDYELGKEKGLPIFCPISTNGFFTGEGGKYASLYHRDVSETIIHDLKKKGLLIDSGKVKHTYPLCWRCDTPLVYLASKQWFLSIDRIKKKMVEENEKVSWYPKWAGQNRFGDWLENAEDWCISRTKVWGTPLNIWMCLKCGSKKVIGSMDELQRALKKPDKLRLHRPWIDMVKFSCDRCGGIMEREEYVLDTWLDSGVAHFASVNYLKDKELFDKLFPYDFITEAIDQTRGWFYTLLFTSTMLFGVTPYKTVLNQGLVLDREGKKMSKSKGNVIWAINAFERFGVDPLRMYLLSKAAPWENMNFIDEEVSRVSEDINIFWNVVSFAKTYFDLDSFDPDKYALDSLLYYARPEDRWLLSKVNTLIKVVSNALKDYNPHYAARAIREFIVKDLSRIYVRSIRRRAWIEELTKDKLIAYATLNYVIKKILLLMAPMAPYVSEYLYQLLRKPEEPESIHMLAWPSYDQKLVDEDLEDKMEIVQDIIASALAARQKGKKKLRWPVSKAYITPKSGRVKSAVSTFQEYVKSTINSKELIILDVDERPREVKESIKPVLSSLGPKLGKMLNKAVEALAKSDARIVAESFKEKGEYELTFPDGTKISISPEDVNFSFELPSNIVYEEGRFGSVYIDLTATEDIEAMSITNEIIRRVQLMRRDMDLNVSDYVECIIASKSEYVLKSLNFMKDYFEEETRSKLKMVDNLDFKAEGYYNKEWKVERFMVRIMLRKINHVP